MLRNYPDIDVVGEVGSIRNAISNIDDLKPDVVLMDVYLQDGDGVEAIKTILSRRADTKVVVLTMYDSEEVLFQAIRNGAVGYLLKSIPMSKLVLSLRAIKRGEAALSREMTHRLISEFQRLGKTYEYDRNDLDALTPRELEVLQLLSTDASNQEIADNLIIAENTVKVHVHNILEKLNVRNRREAAKFARRQGINASINGSARNGG